MATEAKLKANEKYIKEKLDEFKIRVPKGRKIIIQEFAKKQGKSLNSFVVGLINEALETDNDFKTEDK